MKILITGGCGYIGYSLVNKLEKNNKVEKIVIYDNLSNSNQNYFLNGSKISKGIFLENDILDTHALEDAVKDIDIVIHLAAQVSYPYSFDDHHKYEQVNQFGSLQLYQAIKKYPVKKIINLSSASIYGFKTIESEATEESPENAYGISKFNGEKYIKLLSSEVDVFTVRSANVFGFNPCMRLDAVLNKFILDSISKKKVIIYGDGKQTRPFIHIETLVKQIEKMIEGEYKPDTYNLVEENLSLENIRDSIMKVMPNLEFTYVSTLSKFPSSKMYSKKVKLEKDIEQKIHSTFSEISNIYRLS